MILTVERLIVHAHERLRAAAFAPNSIDLLVAGGLNHVRHELEDMGFRDVVVHPDIPSEWPGADEVRKPGALEVRFAFEATASEELDMRREIAPDIFVQTLFPPPDGSVFASLHPYALTWAHPARTAGVWRVFGVAYPFDGEV